MSQQETVTPAISPEQVPGIRGALLRYRIMAYLVGVLLVVLVLIGLATPVSSVCSILYYILGFRRLDRLPA